MPTLLPMDDQSITELCDAIIACGNPLPGFQDTGHDYAIGEVALVIVDGYDFLGVKLALSPAEALAWGPKPRCTLTVIREGEGVFDYGPEALLVHKNDEWRGAADKILNELSK